MQTTGQYVLHLLPSGHGWTNHHHHVPEFATLAEKRSAYAESRRRVYFWHSLAVVTQP